MSALYIMRYASLGAGAGVLYIGRNVVVGVDITENRYEGSYTEESGRIRAELTLSVVADSSQLVTGVHPQQRANTSNLSRFAIRFC